MALMALNACLVMSMANAQTYYLGVLAPQGETVAQERWQPWLNQLNEQLQEDTVVLVPLALENWQQEIEAQQFALVLGPQVQLIKMNTTHWRWLATLQADTAPAKLTAPADINGKDFNEIGFNAPLTALVTECLCQMGFAGSGRANECQVSVGIDGRQRRKRLEFGCIPALNNREVKVVKGFGIFQRKAAHL